MDVTAGAVVVVVVERGVAVEETLRSQGFGGDACMVEGYKERPVNAVDGPKLIRSRVICYIHGEYSRYIHACV